MGETITEWTRWANMILGSVAFSWLCVRSALRWSSYVYTMRLFLLAILFYDVAGTEGSAESAIQHAPVGARSYLFLLANIALLTAMTLTQPKHEWTLKVGNETMEPPGKRDKPV